MVDWLPQEDQLRSSKRTDPIGGGDHPCFEVRAQDTEAPLSDSGRIQAHQDTSVSARKLPSVLI